MWNRLKSLPWSKIIFYGLIAVAVTVGAIWAKKLYWPASAINTTPQVLPEAPKAAKIERIYMPGPKIIYVYPKEELVRKIPQASETANNPQVQYTATAEIPKSPWGGTATAYMNMTTGKGGIGYTAKPRPWVEWGGNGAIGIRAGVGAGNGGSGYAGTLFVRQKLITVVGKPISATGEATGSTYGKPEVKGMVEMEFINWE